MEAFKKYLSNFPLYSAELFDEILPFLSEKYIDEGAHFLREGKVCRNLGFVEEGLLRLYYLTDGKETTTCFCKENTITCSYRSLITQQISDVAIQAIEPTKLLVLSYESLQKLYTTNPFWQQVGRMAAENEYIVTDCHNRFINDLTATERYVQIMETDEEILQRVPLHYLASYLQIAPETLSRIRKKLSRT